jgi:hypothetical protein
MTSALAERIQRLEQEDQELRLRANDEQPPTPPNLAQQICRQVELAASLALDTHGVVSTAPSCPNGKKKRQRSQSTSDTLQADGRVQRLPNAHLTVSFSRTSPTGGKSQKMSAPWSSHNE